MVEQREQPFEAGRSWQYMHDNHGDVAGAWTNRLTELFVPGGRLASVDNLLWDDLRVSLARTQAAAGAPAYSAFKGAALAWAFATGDALGFDLQLPHDIHVGVAGAVLHPHVHWSPGNNTNTGTVHWTLDVEWANPATGDFATLSGSPLSVSTAGAGVAYRHQLSGLGTIDASGFKESTVLMCRLSRNATGDTFSGNAFALSVDWHYRRHSMGSVAEFPA